MRVSEAIVMLQKYYKPEDEIVIAWWDKEWAEADLNRTFTTDEWEELVGDVDIDTDWMGDGVSQTFADALELLDTEDKQ